MPNNKSSFKPIYYPHVKLNNHYVFITIDAYATLSNIDLSLGQLTFTKITYTQMFIFQNKFIFTRDNLCDILI